MMLSLVDAPYRTVSFELLAEADPGLLPRVLQPFARRDLLPDTMKSRCHGGCVTVTVGMAAMPSEMVHLVEGNLRQITGIKRLTVVLGAQALAAA